MVLLGKTGVLKTNDKAQVMNTLDMVEYFSLRCFPEDGKGNLVPLESKQDIPFQIKRSFYVYDAPVNVIRGKHAHKKTEQVLICLRGECKVTCRDEKDQVSYLLDDPTKAIYVPTGIWAEEQYCTEGAILLVYCNTKFNKSDYIRDYDSYVAWRTK